MQRISCDFSFLFSDFLIFLLYQFEIFPGKARREIKTVFKNFYNKELSPTTTESREREKEKTNLSVLKFENVGVSRNFSDAEPDPGL